MAPPCPIAPPALPRSRLLAGAALAGLVVFAALGLTSPVLPITWDEGSSIHRAAAIGRGQWPFTTVIEGHPAFFGIVIHLGSRLTAAWLPPLEAARFGPMVLFGVAAGAMFYRMAREYSRATALAAVAALVLSPRLFAHAHFASYDGTLTAAWVLAWAAFAPARRGRAWALLWGLMLGMTMSAKATGWLAPLPFAAWALVHRDRPALVALAIALPVALATFIALNPPLWSQPLDGLSRFFTLNFHRAGFNIATQFFGRAYDLHHPLPWYNTLVWTAITVPIGLLVLFLLGLQRVVRSRPLDRAGTLLAANWLVLVVVRALPWAPPHDAERLFLPSFAFVAALAGVGALRAVELLERLQTRLAARSARLARAVRPATMVALVYAASATSIAWYAPQWLSYYSLAIGGLRGAAAAGMEPTYYWDGLDREALTWLEKNTAPGEKIRFRAPAAESLALLRSWGELARPFEPAAPGRYRWCVVQRRPSGMSAADRWLVGHARPVFQKFIRRGGSGPWRLDVPILEVYRYEDYLEALRQTAGSV